MQLDKWALSFDGKTINATVPGDIVMDNYKAGIIEDPYYGLNHKSISFINDKDYVYISKFDYKDKFNEESEEVVLSFEGIDLFAEIILNGVTLGSTDNMFKKYEYDVSKIVKEKGNVLEVKMSSTTKYMNALDCKDYFAVFNVPRILIRKEQCCFGWDWSPNIASYGIWKPVNLIKRSKHRIIDVHYTSDIDGEAVIFAELNYFKRSGYDPNGNYIKVKEYDDYLRVSVEKEPNSNEYEVKTVKVQGNKLFVAFKNENAKLWWPIGYGEHPLYNYKVELVRDDVVLSTVEGKLGYRKVELKQKMLDTQLMSYQFYINDKPIFIKGSNWVPVDCFTGCITDEKYKRLIQQAIDGNFNMLRVWGGGVFESDLFYDTCDANGILVWQDFLYACADIPDDNAEWVKNTSEEVIYQIKRLRNHPSLIYWCGGNEKTGSYGVMITYGDYFVDTILRGIVNYYDNTRPYGRQSPCSLTDIGNDKNSGETHHNCAEQCLTNGTASYRKAVSEIVVPFVSECAVMGPDSKQTFEKVFPKDKLWPMNEYWEDRLMDNPYAAIRFSFSQRELKFAEEMYGKVSGIDDFIIKAMLVHAESLKCEVEYSRAHKGVTSGILNWMYSENWPNGTWSIIDYYLEPKHAYYQMAKSFKPILMSFFYNKEGQTVLFGVNDTLVEKQVKFTYGLKTLDGKVVWQEDGNATLNTTTSFTKVVENKFEDKDAYLFVTYSYDGISDTTLYSHDMWKNYKFENDITVNKKQIDENTIEITVKANKFAKDVFINTPNNCDITYSDNYFDVESGETKVVTMRSFRKINCDDVEVTSYVN